MPTELEQVSAALLAVGIDLQAGDKFDPEAIAIEAWRAGRLWPREIRPLAAVVREAVLDAHARCGTTRKTAEVLGIAKSTVADHLRRARQEQP